MLYHYREPNGSIDPSASLKVAGDAGDSLLLGIMKDGSPQSHSITLVEDHQETLKDDPTLVSPPSPIQTKFPLLLDTILAFMHSQSKSVLQYMYLLGP